MIAMHQQRSACGVQAPEKKLNDSDLTICVPFGTGSTTSWRRTMARLYALVGKTPGRASAALERGEELVAMRTAQLTAQVPKHAPARRAPGKSSK